MKQLLKVQISIVLSTRVSRGLICVLLTARDAQFYARLVIYSGLTIEAKIYYCNSIDIGKNTIAIVLVLPVTIAILLQYYCMNYKR